MNSNENFARSPRQANGVSHTSELWRVLRPVDLLVLLVPCVAPVLNLMATNPSGAPHAERLFAFAALLWLLVSGLTAVVVRLGAHRGPAMLVAVVATWIVSNGDGLIEGLGYRLGLLVTGVALFLIGVLAVRLRETPISNILVLAIVVFLATGPLIEVVTTLHPKSASTIAETQQIEVDLGGERPDIWLVVLDGHPGLRAMEQDFGPGASDSFAMRLRDAGYQVPSSAWASYSVTDLSLPSILEMSHPVNSINQRDSTIQDLYAVIAGESRLVDSVERNGYRTYMVESGWSGSSCGPHFDQCIPSHWLDEWMFVLLEPSVLNNYVLKTFGYAFTSGAMATMKWILENAPALADDDEPSFVFAHVMAPHPPFFIDSDCEVVYEKARSGVTFQEVGVSETKRQEYLEGQMACIERFVVELADAAGDQAVVVVVSDHGTDRRNQLSRSPDTWKRADIVERMNSLVAVKGLNDCPFLEPVVLPNVMSHVLSCLSGDQLGAVSAKLHLGRDYQLNESTFKEISQDVEVGMNGNEGG